MTHKRKTTKNDSQAPDRMLTMQEAMNYLSEKGFPCRSRSTFYRVLTDFKIKYVDMNPNGRNEVRRFPLPGLQEFLIKQGLEP